MAIAKRKSPPAKRVTAPVKKRAVAKTANGKPAKVAKAKVDPKLQGAGGPRRQTSASRLSRRHVRLENETPFELLIATILSAQCTDARVNMVTPELFRKWPDAEAMAGAPIRALEKTIQSTGFFRNKAKNIKGASQGIVEKHGGEVPQDLEKLVALPGVGRKTANVVLGTAFGMATGVVVDTHVTRLEQTAGADETHGRRKDRTRFDAAAAAKRVGRLCPPDDSPWPTDLRRAKAEMS